MRNYSGGMGMRHTAPLRRVSLIVGALLVAGCAGSEQSAGSGTEQTRTQIPAGQGAAAMPSADNLIRHMRSLMDLQETAHPALQRFLASNTPRAFAIAPNGASGWASGGSNAASVDQRAIATCESRGGEGGCAVALRDLAIVKPGREWAPASPAAGEGIRSFTHETVPDHRFFWWGPQQGHGVLVFAHGKSGRNDMRGDQPQPWTRHFNNAGFDIWRFDRHPNTDDTVRAAHWLRNDLVELRRRGYRRIVVAGQSRGGWNALMMLDEPGLVDVAIAIAAGAHGERDPTRENALRDTSALRERLRDMERILASAHAAPNARLAVVNFHDDPFDGDPDGRLALLQRYRARFAGFLLIERPEGLNGHNAGRSASFNERYGPCLLQFATAINPPSNC
jgi:hypothetical protein